MISRKFKLHRMASNSREQEHVRACGNNLKDGVF